MVLIFVPSRTELKEKEKGLPEAPPLLRPMDAHVIILRSVDTLVLATDPPVYSICFIICKLLLVSSNKTYSNEHHDLHDWFKNFLDLPPFDICPSERRFEES